jgi:hypothetical protein
MMMGCNTEMKTSTEKPVLKIEKPEGKGGGRKS